MGLRRAGTSLAAFLLAVALLPAATSANCFDNCELPAAAH
jgi:hypothetical protein